METKNAIIKSTMLGYEDHGILTAMLYLDYGDSSQQGFGGYSLGGEYAAFWLKRIFETVGVSKWEDLVGKHVRVKKGPQLNSDILSIGHIMEDKWFSPREEWK